MDITLLLNSIAKTTMMHRNKTHRVQVAVVHSMVGPYIAGLSAGEHIECANLLTCEALIVHLQCSIGGAAAGYKGCRPEHNI